MHKESLGTSVLEVLVLTGFGNCPFFSLYSAKSFFRSSKRRIRINMKVAIIRMLLFKVVFRLNVRIPIIQDIKETHNNFNNMLKCKRLEKY